MVNCIFTGWFCTCSCCLKLGLERKKERKKERTEKASVAGMGLKHRSLESNTVAQRRSQDWSGGGGPNLANVDLSVVGSG